MKKVLISTLTLLITSALVFSQGPIDKNSNLVMGSIGYMSMSGDLYEDDGKGITMLTLGTEYYRFVIDQLGLGLKLAYNSTNMYDEIKSSGLNIGPSATYFFKLANPNLIPFVNAAFTFNSQSSEVGGSKNDGTGTSIYIAGGAGYALGEHVAVLARLNYIIDSFKWDVTGAESESGNIIIFEIGLAGFIY